MRNSETGVSSPAASWFVPDQKMFGQPHAGDPLPFLAENKSEYLFAPLADGLKNYFSYHGTEIDWRYQGKEFDQTVRDILYLNAKLDVALHASHPNWDQSVLKDFCVPNLDTYNLVFTGFGSGGSFRAAISQPENYAGVAKLHQRWLGYMPDMFDIDRKLPLHDSFQSLLDNGLLSTYVGFVSKDLIDEILPISPEEERKGIVCKGVMGKSIVTVGVLHLPHEKSILEVRLSDNRNLDDPIDELLFPDFTIHMTDYTPEAPGDLRVGHQLPASMSDIHIPLYLNYDADYFLTQVTPNLIIGTEQWMSLPIRAFLKMQETFEHPEVIERPVYASIEEALHAGLRAIAEKMQHLGAYGRDTDHSIIPLSQLLHGDWWIKYREELLSLTRLEKTERQVNGRPNLFLQSEIRTLYTRLTDCDARLFLRMAVPMGMIEVLAPEFYEIMYGFGHMFYGTAFSFANPVHVDNAIQIFAMTYLPPDQVRSDNLYRIEGVDLFGSQRFSSLLRVYRKNMNIPMDGPVHELKELIHSPFSLK